MPHYNKPPLSIQQQIKKLQSRGLTINDISKAEHYLNSVSFYRWRAYTYPFQDNKDPNHPFIKPVSFEDLIGLYDFDRRLRLLALDAIEKIEVALRTRIIYEYSLLAGDGFWYLDPKYFKEKKIHNLHLLQIQKEVKRSNEAFIKHYRKNGYTPKEPPAWMAFEVASFGTLSSLYKNLKKSGQKRSIAHYFRLPQETILENWAYNFTIIRNIAAHHSRLWNRHLPAKFLAPKQAPAAFPNCSKTTDYEMYRPLSALVYLMSHLTPKSSYKQKMKSLILSCPLNQTHQMGFPAGWEQGPFWR